jgi:hypothetical protein
MDRKNKEIADGSVYRRWRQLLEGERLIYLTEKQALRIWRAY